MQHVTYHDWLPIILGEKVMQGAGLSVRGGVTSHYAPPWRYDPAANPTIINAFATAAFRSARQI